MQKANYYQFHKGSYFDSSLTALTQWHGSSLQTLSFVQDPLPTDASLASFAQPLVFFTFHPLINLSTSPVGENVHALRFRIPDKNIGSFISAAPTAFPSLQTLDIATSSTAKNTLTLLLDRLYGVQRINLDSCKTLTANLRELTEWKAFGRDCALVGARRVKEREKEVKSWLESLRREHSTSQTLSSQTYSNVHRPKARAGRKGLATASISLRGASDPTIIVQPPSQISGGSSSNTAVPSQKIRIAPSPPSLHSISVSPPHLLVVPGGPQNEGEFHTSIRESFAQGWREGLGILRLTWTRLQISQSNKVARVMMIKTKSNDPNSLDGLEDLEEDGWKELTNGSWDIPNLCLEGETSSSSHANDCVHTHTNTLWVDNLT